MRPAAPVTGDVDDTSCTVKGTDGDDADIQPAASVAVAATSCAPGVRGQRNGTSNTPSAPAAASPTSVAPSATTRTVERGSALPLTIGSGVPRISPATGEVMIGGAGGMVSTSTFTPLEGSDRFPAASTATPTKTCQPSDSGAGVNVNEPSNPARTVPSPTSPAAVSSNSTWLRRSALPAIVGVGVVSASRGLGASSTGAGGGVTSQASPSPTPSSFSCPGLGTPGQLSVASGTVSPSASPAQPGTPPASHASATP